MDYQEHLLQTMQSDPRLFVLTAENWGPLYRIPSRMPERFLDVGIMEQTMIGIAAGLALRGRRPVAHALAAFLTMRPYEFIRTSVGLPRLPVILVGALSGVLSEGNGATHQAIEDVSIMRSIPGMNIFCPADEGELVSGMDAIVASGQPWYIRYPGGKSEYAHTPMKLGEAEQIGTGTSIALLTYGTLFGECLRVKEALEEAGCGVRLLNMRTLEPLDREAVIQTARSCSTLVTVEDHLLRGGLYSAVCEILVEERISVNLVPFALRGYFHPASLAKVLDLTGLSSMRILASLEAQRLIGRTAQVRAEEALKEASSMASTH